MSAVLIGTGAGILLALGIAHAVFTMQSAPDGGPMMPTNASTRQAMNTPGGLGMAPDIDATLFKAWIGFNYSHALGLVVTGAVLLYHSVINVQAAADQSWFVILATIVPAIYLALAQLYWFDKPRDAIAFASLLLWAGTILELL